MKRQIRRIGSMVIEDLGDKGSEDGRSAARQMRVENNSSEQVREEARRRRQMRWRD